MPISLAILGPNELPEVIRRVESGVDVSITRGDGGAFRIVRTENAGPVPTFGSGVGLAAARADFDSPTEDFAPCAT